MASSLAVWFVFVLFCFGRVCVVVLFCFALIGQSSDKTSESTNDSMSGFTKTATIVTMSAATVEKKSPSRLSLFVCVGFLFAAGFSLPASLLSCH